MGRYARKKGKAASCKGIGRRGGKTKTKTRDLDQIKNDLTNNSEIMATLAAETMGNEKVSDLYCTHCARMFQTQDILMKHLRSKSHKHRVRILKDWPAND